MARVTKRQKEIAADLVKQIEAGAIPPELVAEHIRQENEYMEKKKKAQTPTREQMQRPFNI